MIGTLAWKEQREHQGIWLTMAVMTVVVGWGLPRIVSQGDQVLFLSVSLMTTLGMTVAYGVVCGAMMFAGEHEGGTMAFLDIFHGRRGQLWTGKAAIGTVLVITEGLAVALFLWSIGQEAPSWGPGVGIVNGPLVGPLRPGPEAWFAILPIVALEAFAWGLLGSSVTRRALPGAAIGAVGASVCWMFTFSGVLELIVTVRLAAAVIVLVLSYYNFLTQPKESSPPRLDLEPTADDDAREAFLERYDEFEREDELLQRWAERERAALAPDMMIDREGTAKAARSRGRVAEPNADAVSPRQVLWWLVLEQYRLLLLGIPVGCLMVGLVVSLYAQILWPIATLVLGVVCGVAAFAPEQRDQSYQFLAAQHFPLRALWRFKILCAGAAAVAFTLLLALGTFVGTFLQMQVRRPDGFAGPLYDRMGPALFLGVWLAYGFGVGQIVVWLCRKNILALLLSILIAAGTIVLWLPPMIAGGMNGWQLWMTPALLLLVGWCLVRAWAGGRIQERRPILALAGFVAVALTWAALVFAYRALEIPDVGPPLDVAAFRAGIPLVHEDRAAKEISAALDEFAQIPREQGRLIAGFQVRFGAHDIDKTLAEARRHLQAASRLPTGVLETPRAEGMPTLLHLGPCKKLADVLLVRSQQMKQADAAACVSEVLTLSRNLRNMAPIESYLAGTTVERMALTELDAILAREKPTAELLHRLLDDLNLHAGRTPPALDCIRTECFRSTGMVLDPQSWNLAVDDRRAPSWLRGSIGLSLETPWESERKTRLWRLAWAGLLRGFETPDWKIAEAAELPPTRKSLTRNILNPWLPGDDGVSRDQMTRLLDSSWLADEKLFCSAETLRIAALRSQVRVDLSRLAVALALYRLEEHGPPENLGKLSKWFAAGDPVDPYAGQAYRYRNVPGDTRVWSTGPDRVDDGGLRDGDGVSDNDPRWRTGKLDLVKNEPRWP
ncbi:MAG TPA: hypothetical protein VHR72_05670 [Gemmataceae bacterium]|jgi:hypothetical protein|nr:hypothetical protein [Gemmataceae bacterium]